MSNNATPAGTTPETRTCPACKGDGAVEIDERSYAVEECSGCEGRGEVAGYTCDMCSASEDEECTCEAEKAATAYCIAEIEAERTRGYDATSELIDDAAKAHGLDDDGRERVAWDVNAHFALKRAS